MAYQNGTGPAPCADSRVGTGIGDAGKLRLFTPPQNQPQALRAELTGSTTATAAGLTSTSPTPVLSLCKQLLAAGLSPDAALDVYRGATLALRVRSVGQAATLELAGDGAGFRTAREPDAAPPVHRNGRDL